MKVVLDNGIRVVLEETKSDICSICIGFEAGAAVERGLKGLAHATEHMIYKGTKNRSEDDINVELSNIFAFQNAMTNYPYAIYYGSALKEDFEKALELFSDIIINPIFPKEGFKEEMDVIIQELSEWDEDLEQYCEDKLFINSINSRLKYPIIGTIDDLKEIKLNDIKQFYSDYYYSGNMVITIVSSLCDQKVIEKVNKYFANWDKAKGKNVIEEKKSIKAGIYNDYREGINTAKIEIIYDISELTNYELGLFRVFNEYFGEGVNSILFNELRTKRGLVYDVLTSISYEKHIGLYKINCTTSKEKIDKVINTYLESINLVKEIKNIDELIKRIKMKKLFKVEQGIVLAKVKTVNEVMGKEILDVNNISSEEIFSIVNKVMKNPAIEVIRIKE